MSCSCSGYNQNCCSFHRPTSKHPKMSHSVISYNHHASRLLSLFDHILKHVRNNRLLSAFCFDACHRGGRKSSEVAGELLNALQRISFAAAMFQTSSHHQALMWALFRTLLISNYPNPIQETWHSVFLLTSMDLMVLRLWSLPSTTLIHPCSAMAPRKTESEKETPNPRITYNKYLVIALMCDLEQAGSPLFGASLSHHV